MTIFREITFLLAKDVSRELISQNIFLVKREDFCPFHTYWAVLARFNHELFSRKIINFDESFRNHVIFVWVLESSYFNTKQALLTTVNYHKSIFLCYFLIIIPRKILQKYARLFRKTWLFTGFSNKWVNTAKRNIWPTFTSLNIHFSNANYYILLKLLCKMDSSSTW